MSFVLETSRELDRVERRVLGALRCVDATTSAPLRYALRIDAPAGARIQRNRSGLFVIQEWAPPVDHATAFLGPPPGPADMLSLTVGISDPTGHYLPRLVRVELPRDASPSGTALPGSLFRPLQVPMYPSCIGRLGPNWAALSLSVREIDGGEALGGVLLRVVSAGQVLARGLSDWRGEALVPVAGIPVTTGLAGPCDVITTQIEARVEAFADPAGVTRTPQADVIAGRAPPVRPLVDPVAIEAARARLPQASAVVGLVAGRTLHVSLGIPLV